MSGVNNDFLLTTKYCRSFLFILAIFFACSLVSDDNVFFLFLPCVFSGVMPVTLLTCHEQSRWDKCSAAVSCSKAQIVSSEYMTGLWVLTVTLLISAIGEAVRMSIHGGFKAEEFIVLMLMLFSMSCAASAISLPLMFKLGIQKGRIAYFIVIAVFCGGFGAASNKPDGSLLQLATADSVLILISLAVMALYALSWYLSVMFYRK